MDIQKTLKAEGVNHGDTIYGTPEIEELQLLASITIASSS